jgi:hypothetical protein
VPENTNASSSELSCWHTVKYWLLYFCTDLFNSQHYLCVRQFLRSDFIYFIHESSSSHECAEPKWQYCYHPYCHYENSLAITSMFFNTRVWFQHQYYYFVCMLCVFDPTYLFLFWTEIWMPEQFFLKFSRLHLEVIKSQPRKLIISVPPHFFQDLFIEMPGIGFKTYFNVLWNSPIY